MSSGTLTQKFVVGAENLFKTTFYEIALIGTTVIALSGSGLAKAWDMHSTQQQVAASPAEQQLNSINRGIVTLKCTDPASEKTFEIGKVDSLKTLSRHKASGCELKAVF